MSDQAMKMELGTSLLSGRFPGLFSAKEFIQQAKD